MSLLKNAGFNFLGAAVPALVSLATLPYIVKQLGADDYGLLVIITSIVGYFALLDINVTAGSTKYVSGFYASGDRAKVNQTISFGLIVYGVIGCIGMCLIFFLADYLVTSVFSVSQTKKPEAVSAIEWAAVGFLVGQIQTYVQSLPGALMRYDISGRVEALFGFFLPVFTVLLLYFGYGLVELVALRVAMSVLQITLVSVALKAVYPDISWMSPEVNVRRALLSFSAYSFLSRIAAITYSHVDKLIIGARIGASSVTHYSVPATLSNRVMSLIFRLAGVMFPHASALASRGELSRLREDYLLATRLIFYVNGAAALVLCLLSKPLLSLWLGPEFSTAGFLVMSMIAAAQWIDSATNLPSMVNDAMGHPKVTGFFAISRALVGLSFILAGVEFFGINGAAGGHLIASFIMTVVFIRFVHGRTVPIDILSVVKYGYLPSAFVLSFIGFLSWLCPPLSGDMFWDFMIRFFCILFLLSIFGFFYILPQCQRVEVLKKLKISRSA